MEGWRHKNRPECLEKRYEFESYEKTRDFLDALGDFSEKIIPVRGEEDRMGLARGDRGHWSFFQRAFDEDGYVV